MVRTDEMVLSLSPEVGRFVLRELRRLEEEQVCDAPGVIGGIVRRMQSAESDHVRSAAPWVATLLRRAYARRYLNGVSA